MSLYICEIMVAEWLNSWLAEQEIRFPASPLEFQRLLISRFQVAIWLKYRLSDLNPQYNQPTITINVCLLYFYDFSGCPAALLNHPIKTFYMPFIKKTSFKHARFFGKVVAKFTNLNACGKTKKIGVVLVRHIASWNTMLSIDKILFMAQLYIWRNVS